MCGCVCRNCAYQLLRHIVLCTKFNGPFQLLWQTLRPMNIQQCILMTLIRQHLTLSREYTVLLPKLLLKNCNLIVWPNWLNFTATGKANKRKHNQELSYPHGMMKQWKLIFRKFQTVESYLYKYSSETCSKSFSIKSNMKRLVTKSGIE